MSETPPNGDRRLVRVLTPAPLLREVDALVRQGLGGYESRQEFFLDAVENHLLEVKYGSNTEGARRLPTDNSLQEERAELPSSSPAQGVPAESAGFANGAAAAAPVPAALASETPAQRFADFTSTEVEVVAAGPRVKDGIAVAENEPLFGLHNRDYPSIWAAGQLALQTQGKGALIPWKDFLERTTAEAWRFAASLEDLDNAAPTKLTALFPKNWTKPQSAEESFKAFAIGSIAKKQLDGGKRKASGPLFTWGVIQVKGHDGALHVGLTDEGYGLLMKLQGISLRLPHEQHYAKMFLDYLAEHAPADAAGFGHLLEVVPNGLTRTELADRFGQWQPQWSATEANTYAAAYVARAREWGLLEEKLIDRRYALTSFGEQRLGGSAS